MKYPYLITSDQHCHAWSAFSKPNPDGVNSRLRIILNEMDRARSSLKASGGTHHFGAGDLFHQRGEIKPSVFNPTYDSFQAVVGVEEHFLTGNHDLEGKDSSSLGNAMQALDALPHFTAHTQPALVGDVLVVPWIQDLNELRSVLKAWSSEPNASSTDVIIHAPVNGVLKGIPDHGLEASELAAYGFRRVFSGHYHNHVVMEGGKVFSVGATTHQTWSDPGTKAGFLLVYEDRVEFHENEAPKFIDLTLELVDDTESLGGSVEDLVKGNYVRMKLTDVTEREIKEWRVTLEQSGAAGVTIIATKKAAATARTGAGVKAGSSLGSSVEHFIRNDLKPQLVEKVSKLAQDVLQEAQS